jgi:hypothetical protein
MQRRVSTHEAPRSTTPAIWRAIGRAIPNPVLALPVLLLAVGLLLEAPARISGDTWFDLVSGRDILQHGLPHSDRLMAFTAGRRWEDQQWLAHLADYGLYALGGLPLVALTDVACLIGTLLIAMTAARRLGGSPLWVTAVASPVILLLIPTTVRAQSFAMPLFAVLLWLLARDARTPDRRILLALPLLVLWANLHGSILLGSALILLHCTIGIGHALRRRELGSLRRPLALACAALLAPFASPYGPQLVQYYRATASSSAFQAFVTEWAGTTLRAWPAFFVVAALVLVAVIRPETRLNLFETLCLVGLVLAGLDTVRNIVWLPVAAVILLPQALTRWSPETASRSWLRPLLAVFALAGSIGVGLLAASLTTAKLERQWPTASGAAIAHAAALDPSLRVVSQEGYSDWLLWRYPDLRGRIAFDIRFELLGATGLKDVIHFEDAAGPRWDRPFRGYRLALLEGSSKPEVVAALRAEPGTSVLAHRDGVYALERVATATSR